MAVRQQHGEGSTASSMSISTTEPMATIDCSKIIHSEIIDSDVDENTENTPKTLDKFPKYEDCQETLFEMSFIKWLAGFRLECRKISCRINTELYIGLFNFFCLNIVPEMVDCRNKINKSTLMKSYLEQIMMFFRGYYKTIKKDKGDTLDVIYYDRMSSILAYYIDLKLMSSQRYKKNLFHQKFSSKINTMLFVFLDRKLDHMFDSVLKLYYVFYGSVISNLGSIMLPVFKKLLSEHPMPEKINFLTYMRYILCFKLWEKIIHSSPSMADSVKKKELENLRLLLRVLNVPNDFVSQYEKYNWPNWPKLTIPPNEMSDSTHRNRNVSFILYNANLSLKKCHKDILAVPKKDIPILLKPIEEQCKMLRPDLFAIPGKEVLKNWSEHFDDTLKPLIPTTRSCNSLVRKIKYNLFTPSKYVCLDKDNEINDVRVVPINDDLSKLKNFGDSSENHSLPSIDNFLHSDKKCIKKTNLINSSTNKIIDESNNDKKNKNEKFSGDALKTLMATLGSFSANVKSQSSEDEVQVNVKKSKSFEKHVLFKDDSKFDPTLSNNPSRLNNISEITSTSHHHEISNSKGLKRNQCSSFSENSKNEKNCRIKSKHENNILNSNPNQIIDSNCHNSNIENISHVTSNNDNFVHENPKNSLNINGVFCLTNKPSVKENKWVTKAPYPESSITSVLNLKHTESNFTASCKDKSITNSTKIISFSIDQDGTASPSSDIQRPIKLSQSDPYPLEPKPDKNTKERGSSSNKNKPDVLDELSDEFRDVHSVDLRINNNLSRSSLISTDLISINTLNSFEKCGNWSTIENKSDTTNHHQKQKLKICTDPVEMISVPNNLNTQSAMPINLNEAHVKKVFLENERPLQVDYSPFTDFRVSSSLDMTNHENIEDSNLLYFKNRHGNCVNICSNNDYIHPMLQPTDNNPNAKQTLINGYNGVLNQNPLIINDSNTSLRYENPLILQYKNPERMSPHNLLHYSSYDQILGPSLLEDSNQKIEQLTKNMAHLMLQTKEICYVYYKWPINKTKNQTSSNEKLLEVPQSQDYKRNSNVLYKDTDELSQKLLPNDTGLSFYKRINSSTLIQPNRQFQDPSNFIAPDHPTIQSGSESIDKKTQIQSQAVHSFESIPRKEPIEYQEMYRNTKISNQSQESSTSRSITDYNAAHHLFISGKLVLCIYPKCTNSRHFRVIPSNAEILRHQFTVPFDYFRYHIQCKYKQLITLNPNKSRPNFPVLEQLTKRCLCKVCGEFDSILSLNQKILNSYTESKKPSIEKDNFENEKPINTRILLNWKKRLAQRFISAEYVENHSISQMIDHMEKHVKHFKHAFHNIFPLDQYEEINLLQLQLQLQNACDSYFDADDSH